MRRTCFLFVVLCLAPAANAQVASDAEPVATLDVPLPLEAVRSEEADDEVTAEALLAHGRMLERRRESLAALRRYQRAYRYDPKQRGLPEIVRLAMDIGRTYEAARYAVLPGEKITDTILLRRLAIEATNRRDWPLAARLYEVTVAAQEADGSKSAMQILLRAELGRLLFLSGQHAKADESFAKVREALARPDDYSLNESIQKVIVADRKETYSLMARAALEAGKHDDALSLYQEAFRDQSESTESLLAQALVRERQEKQEQAEQILFKVLERGDGQSTQAIGPLRRLYHRISPDNVEARLEEKLVPVHLAHPDNNQLSLEFAKCLVAQDKREEAKTLLNSLDGSADAGLLLASLQRKANEPDRWLETLSKVAAKGFSLTEAELLEGAQNESFAEEAIKSVLATEAQSEEQRWLKSVAAHVALERKRLDDADQLWRASLPADTSAQGRLKLEWGRRLTQADQYDRSVAVFQEAIEAGLPSNELAPAYFYLSGAAALADRFDLAIEAAGKAAKLRSDDIRYLNREPWVLQYAKRYPEARDKYEAMLNKFRRSNDQSIREQLREARLALSTIYLQLRDEKNAFEKLEEVLDEFPEDATALNDLGYLWGDRRLHLQRSLRMVQRAVAIQPENKAYRDSLGWVLYRLGRYEEAVAEFELAASGEQPGGLLLDHLGDARFKAGQTAQARLAWRRALEAYGREGNVEAASEIEKKIRNQ